MAIHSSLINFVSAIETRTQWICSSPDSPIEAECVFTAKDGTNTSYDCKYNTTTKTWTCTVAEKTGSATTNERTDSNTLNKLTGSQIPLGLKSALDSAIKSQNGGLAMRQNNTEGSRPVVRDHRTQ